jgi:hypothetical protein
MSSAETDSADRAERQRQLDANLREARAGMNRLRRLADEPAPERDDGDDS